MTTCQIRVGHPTPMIGAHWVEPVGWTPANEVPGAEFRNGSWWNGDEEVAGIACFTQEDFGAVSDVAVEDLRVVACGEWKILQDVIPSDAGARS